MSAIDSVVEAKNTPELVQPFAQLGLKDDEYAKIKEILGRRPTSSELAMYSVMWSEHCSYKSSKIHLRQFGEKATKADCLLVGIGQNAGVVDIGQGYAVTFKIESHNHPSFVEPYQGAATGVGGIVRDILTMGARPIAVMDSLRFGPLNHPDTSRVLPGVVAGISGYGNCLGLPNIGGETSFDKNYLGNPLVNALAVGVMRHSDIKLAKATGPGNLVVLFGAKTGGDGIGGVSILASETFASEKSKKRPSVQVGDPFTEKILIECSLEIFTEDLVVGIQDLGGAGLSCATSELASGGSGGMNIYLDRVPLRDESLSPEEILMSESQERMCAIVEPEKIARFLGICEKWDVTATVIGEVAEGETLRIYWHEALVVEVPPRSVAHDGPVYHRPIRKPENLLQLTREIVRPPIALDERELNSHLIKLLSSDNICDKNWITDKYDRYVRGNTVASTPDNAGVIRVDEQTHLGIAISCDSRARWSYLDPYRGVQHALSEGVLNVASMGATPLALSNCLNFGSPEIPEIMWQFAETVRGLADGAAILGLPVTGGNISFYNQTQDQAILPTPVVALLGVIEDVRKVRRIHTLKAGLELALIGRQGVSFTGSQWGALHDLHGGRVPEVDFDLVSRLLNFLASARGICEFVHDVSEGGIVTTLFEMTYRNSLGCEISWDIAELFSEMPHQLVIATADYAALSDIADSMGVPCARLGTTGGGTFSINGWSIDLAPLTYAYDSVLTQRFAQRSNQ
jgi:phosphoribosylformylglycinamidine synthase